MATVYMLVGIPGSGKSTFARKLSADKNIPIISSDEVRNQNPNLEEKLIFPEVYRLIAQSIENNIDCIYDATNISPKVRHRLVENLAPYNLKYDVIVYYFNTDFELCYERVGRRNNRPNERYFPLDKLKGYYDNLIKPTVEEGFKEVIEIDQK